MKKVFFICVLLFFICKVFAQDLTIFFQPKVSGTPIDSIQAINLRTNQVVKLSGGESLVLVKTPTSINPLQDNLELGAIYPNPSDGDATFSFSTDKNQEVELRLYNASGQLLNQNRQCLAQGTHRFDLKFPIAGIYFVSLLKSDGPASFKAVYTGRKIQNSAIEYAGSEKLYSQKPSENQLKSATTDKTLSYSTGDVIQYSFFSGVNTTIASDIPTTSKALDVEFVSCIDKDNKSYKVVKIDDQWWMAENLAYLPAVSPTPAGSITDPYYYVYGYSGTDVSAAKATSNYNTFGVLYNWPAALAACPPGWHLPRDDEWTALTTFLGGTDQGMQMKATSGWNNNGNGTNSSGFAALPAGYISSNGPFEGIGYKGYWWSSTEFSTIFAWNRGIAFNGTDVYTGGGGKDCGFSVRCVRD